MSYIFRFLSAILIICIVAPTFLASQVVNAVFEIVNGFTYENFINYPMDYSKLQASGVPFKYFGILKIWMIISVPILMIFVNFFNGVKLIRF